MPNTIVLKGDLEKRHEEGRAAAVVKPGHLCAADADNKIVPHATLGGHALPMFAKEDALQGRTIRTAYAINDVVLMHIAQSGDEIYAVLKAGQNAANGAALSSQGDGTLKVTGVGEQVIAFCTEALDLSAGGSVDTFVKTRIK